MFNTIRDHLNRAVPFAKLVGVNVATVAQGVADASLVQRTDLDNHIASLHAGALFTLAEAASGAAMSGALGERLVSVRPLVASSTIQYRKIAHGRIDAHATVAIPAPDILARLDADGKTSVEVSVRLTDAIGDEVATFIAAWHLRTVD